MNKNMFDKMKEAFEIFKRAEKSRQTDEPQTSYQQEEDGSVTEKFFSLPIGKQTKINVQGVEDTWVTVLPRNPAQAITQINITKWGVFVIVTLTQRDILSAKDPKQFVADEIEKGVRHLEKMIEDKAAEAAGRGDFYDHDAEPELDPYGEPVVRLPPSGAALSAAAFAKLASTIYSGNPLFKHLKEKRFGETTDPGSFEKLTFSSVPIVFDGHSPTGITGKIEQLEGAIRDIQEKAKRDLADMISRSMFEDEEEVP